MQMGYVRMHHIQKHLELQCFQPPSLDIYTYNEAKKKMFYHFAGW